MTTDKDDVVRLVRSFGAGIAKNVLDNNVAFCVVYNTPVLSIPNGTWTSVMLNGDSYDPMDWHGTATNTERINISVSALWLAVVFNANFDTNTTGIRAIRVLDSDGNVFGSHFYAPVAGTYTTVPFSAARYCGGAGKYIYVQVYQTSGGTLGLVTLPKIALLKINPHSSMM